MLLLLQIDTLDAGLMPMSQLHVGDKVASVDAAGRRFYDEVYFFGHQSKDAVSEMVTFTTSNATLTLSKRYAHLPCLEWANADLLDYLAVV